MESVSKCPKCGGQLETRKFVDSWNERGEPVDVNEDLYCPNCRLRWSCEEVDPKISWKTLPVISPKKFSLKLYVEAKKGEERK